MTHKLLQNYKRSQSLSQSPTELAATLFYKCSSYVTLIEQNIKNKEYYERFVNSEKVSLLLTQLMASLNEESPETRTFSLEMKRFCYLILSYITEINQKERIDLCQKTAKLLSDMGEVWQNIKKGNA